MTFSDTSVQLAGEGKNQWRGIQVRVILRRMFCPVCKLEYRPGFTRCNDCDVPLVARLDDVPVPTNTPKDPDAAELLWTGTDRHTFATITRVLDAAEMSYHTQTRDVGPLPGLAQPVFAIIIYARDHNAARTVLEDVRRLLECPQQGEDGDASELESSEQGLNGPTKGPLDAEPAGDSFAPEQDYVPEDFDPDEATSEVWSGAQTDLRDMLISCLRENGVGCAVEEPAATHRIRVMPSSEKRAKEIIREVVEASESPE